MGLPHNAHNAHATTAFDPDDLAFCIECDRPYPMARYAIGYKTCLQCGEHEAQRIAQRNNVAGASSQSRYRQPATSPLPHSDAHTLAEYRRKHTDPLMFIRNGRYGGAV